jgi:hypothetical protein
MTFQIQFNECERDKSLDNLFDFLDELKKSLTKTHFGCSNQHVKGEAKAPIPVFYENLVSYR